MASLAGEETFAALEGPPLPPERPRVRAGRPGAGPAMSSAPDSLEIMEADRLVRGLRDRSVLCEEEDREERTDGDGGDIGRDTTEASGSAEGGPP